MAQTRLSAGFQLFTHYWVYLLFSALIIGSGIFFMLRGGLRPAIDFTGGSLLELEFSEPQSELSAESIHQTIAEVYEPASTVLSGQNTYLMKGQDISNEEKSAVIATLTNSFGSVQELRFETLGPTLGRELLIKTVLAVAIVSVVIALYLMRQFSELKYGIAAVFAMLHDSLMLFAAFAVLGYFLGVEVDVLFVTALLTTLSFSVHDTIVLFHRIRELKKTKSSYPLAEVANAAVIQTASRSVNNSLTIIIMLLALTFLGGESLRWFSVALLVGAITGTYSSPFTAIPFLLLFQKIDVWRKKVKLKK